MDELVVTVPQDLGDGRPLGQTTQDDGISKADVDYVFGSHRESWRRCCRASRNSGGISDIENGETRGNFNKKQSIFFAMRVTC